MTLVRFDKVSLEFGDQPLLVDSVFSVEPRERVCLIGRNGAGKSSLLKLITGKIQPDSGEIQYRTNLRISQLEQELPSMEDSATVKEVVGSGLSKLRRSIEEYHRLSELPADRQSLQHLEVLQRTIESQGGWQIDQQVETVMSRLQLPAESKLKELSGGWQRRVALGRALVSQPDLLLLDEPTNHLDISTIEWLEQEIHAFTGSVLFVTHDRMFLQSLATRIVELDRGALSSWPGNYNNYLQRKEKQLEDEARHNAVFDKKLAQEEAWIRQGIKARRTRDEGRVRALQKMREQYTQRIKQQGSARIHMEEAEQSGRKVIEARNITHGYDGEALINNFSLKVMRGDRIALVGNNGVGKTTLLRILLGDLQPDKGSVKLGTNIKAAYFDQLRAALDPEKTIAETVGDGREYIKLYGKDRHIIGYLKDFLFSPKRAMTPIKALSGGERNRVILAKLFTRASNLLVLDEPTNDLDVEMLEVLEQRLVEYNGTIIVVSHDRNFLDNIVTSTLVFETGARIEKYAGGYSDWLRRGKQLSQSDTSDSLDSAQPGKNAGSAESGKTSSNKLSYKLQRELDMLPAKIEALEQDIEVLQKQANASDFYTQGYEQYQPVLEQLNSKQAELDQLMERWAELEGMQNNSN